MEDQQVAAQGSLVINNADVGQRPGKTGLSAQAARIQTLCHQHQGGLKTAGGVGIFLILLGLGAFAGRDYLMALGQRIPFSEIGNQAKIIAEGGLDLAKDGISLVRENPATSTLGGVAAAATFACGTTAVALAFKGAKSPGVEEQPEGIDEDEPQPAEVLPPFQLLAIDLDSAGVSDIDMAIARGIMGAPEAHFTNEEWSAATKATLLPLAVRVLESKGHGFVIPSLADSLRGKEVQQPNKVAFVEGLLAAAQAQIEEGGAEE